MSPSRLVLVLPFLVFACADSHGNDPDASSVDAGSDTSELEDTGGCNHDGPRPSCTNECADGDGVLTTVCVEDQWVCPPGTVDVSTCSGGCPAGIDARDPDAPGSACSTEGATCSEGTQCGSAMFCTCESGRWNCGVAEPDPVCWCGREPEVGDACNGEAPECGQCCPTAEGPNWPPMSCVDGAWQPTACEEIACPEVLLECPVDIESVLGTACVHDAQSCGNPCCGSIQCNGGIWERGPLLGCACELAPACGSGSCTAQQSCNVRCGPDDGSEYYCRQLPEGCDSCECAPLLPGQTCEMIEGRVHVNENEICG